ncbi:MAG: GNAT family N-acetyltransferase [Candidatus Taylorbacteria bacterium]
MKAHEAVSLLFSTHTYVKHDAWFPTLFGGDRLSCCDEAVVVMVEGCIAALATIAPEGEMTSGHPTIVGLYTVRAFRQQGYGKMVLEATVRRCMERGFTKVHIDVLTPKAMMTVNTLQLELRNVLEVVDQSACGCFLE